MLLGFAQPQRGDFAYLNTPRSTQMACWVLNRITWYPGDDSGALETGTASTGWRANTAGYAQVSLLIPVLVGTGTNGSGQVTSPLDPTGAANPTLMTLADVASGVWDTLYTTMFTNLATYLPTNTILRVGNEWYGSSWYPWNGPSQGYAGKAAYQHLVTLARSISTNFRFEWLGCLDLSLSGGYSFTDVQNFYPGDSYVDFLSGDIYDTTTGTVGQAMWNYRAAQMSQCLAFAQSHGKPYCITEWGLQNIAQTGIGNDDDYAYIQAAYRWMRANEASLGWATYFNTLTWDGRLQHNPQSEAMFSALFGAWGPELMSGVTSHRFATPGFGTIGAVKAVGALVHAKATGLKTLAVTPQAVGNVLVLTIINPGWGLSVSSVTGGGVTTWTKLAQANPAPGGVPGDTELWYGAVTTAGAATVTASSTATGTTILGCQEFTIGTPATWATDTSGASTSTTAAASGTYPSVTPTGRNELYVGASLLLGGTMGGATAGFVYLRGSTFEANAQFVYNAVASNPTAQAPAWTQTSGYWSAVSGLLTATPVTPGQGSHRLRLA